jgi:hypothetical protein
MRRLVLSSCAIALLTLAACDGGGGLISPRPPADPASVARTITLGGKQLFVEPFVYRDFTPGIGPREERRLIVGLRITTVDGSEVPPNVRADAAWVINGDQVWATPVEEHFARFPGLRFFDVSADGGPLWAPGTPVDVIVRIRETGGPNHLLGAPQSFVRTVS